MSWCCGLCSLGSEAMSDGRGTPGLLGEAVVEVEWGKEDGMLRGCSQLAGGEVVHAQLQRGEAG